ncbi:hypothetical protein GCM10010207_65430 [Streptomyces atratus]|nr:hypothetical protein GCM10010207_65430 [Streptomyces atratus]
MGDQGPGLKVTGLVRVVLDGDVVEARALRPAGQELVDVPHGDQPAPGESSGAGLSPEVVRKATFEEARRTMPNVAIGDLDAFGEELV